MAIGYYKLKRKLNVNGKIKEVYVAKVARANIVDTDILAEEISSMCSASEGDVVKLSSLGTFSPTIRAKAVDKPEDVNQFSITGTGINFKPTQRLLSGVREAGVWLADKRIMKSIVRKKSNNE